MKNLQLELMWKIPKVQNILLVMKILGHGSMMIIKKTLPINYVVDLFRVGGEAFVGTNNILWISW